MQLLQNHNMNYETPPLLTALTKAALLTSGFSATCLAQERMMRMASMLVSGKAALHAYSERHFIAS